MVHHLQNVGGLKYECPQAREKPAYRAQSQWLGLFGRNLADEFEIDRMTLLVRTSCMYVHARLQEPRDPCDCAAARSHEGSANGAHQDRHL